MSAIAEENAEAFEELYGLWSPILFGLVFKILNDAKEAEDVLQEGFLHVWNKAHTYDARRSSPSTWAFMIFRNKAIDHLRSRARRSHGIDKIATENPGEIFTAEIPDGQASQQEKRVAVRAALEEISADQREAISLAFFSGLTQAEIADQLGAPLGTVKARIRRGLLKLGATLEGKL